MLEETGTVIDVRDHIIRVEAQSRSACSHCSSSGCTTSVVSRLFGVRRNSLKLENSLGANTGDRVVIGIPDELLVRASMWAYLLPLSCMVTGAVIGSVLGASDGSQSLLALGGLAVGFFAVRWSTRNLSSQQHFKPQLLRFASDGQVRIELPSLTRS